MTTNIEENILQMTNIKENFSKDQEKNVRVTTEIKEKVRKIMKKLKKMFKKRQILRKIFIR